MAVEHHSAEIKLLEAVQQLRDQGVRITPQRQAVLTYLIEADTHPTADEIYKALSPKFDSMSVATIYNNLKVFKECGLVSELTYGDAASRYDFETANHYHVICTSCGKITDFQYPRLDEVEQAAQHLTGHKITHHRMEIYGICPECAKKEER